MPAFVLSMAFFQGIMKYELMVDVIVINLFFKKNQELVAREMASG